MNKFEALKEIFDLENIEQKITNSNTKTITTSNLLNTISKSNYSLKEDLNVSSGAITRLLKQIWPERIVSNNKLCNYLFTKYDLKYCSNCDQVKPSEEFSKNSARAATGLNSHCRECCLDTRRDYQRYYQAGIRSLKLTRTPTWSNPLKIKEIYDNCPEGYHVDHIVPLQGTLVCGLHVENNLQYLLAEDNLRKQNKFDNS